MVGWIPMQFAESDMAKEEIALSEEELETTIKVLSAFDGDKSLLEGKSKLLKDIRRLLHQLGSYQFSKAYSGKTREEYTEAKRLAKEKTALENRKKAQDRKLIESRSLRKARRLQLAALLQENDVVPLIPDGAVDDGFNTSVGQSGGTEQVPVVLIDKHGKPLEDGANGRAKEEAEAELHNPQSCYACKARFYQLHHFYATFCPDCAKVNWDKRHQQADLSGKVALVTGGRVKIGYQIALKLLRMQAKVMVTTRFPADAALRFAKESDFEEWKDRLMLFKLDFKSIYSVQAFCSYIVSGKVGFGRLDMIINNACQTIRRPQEYYRHLLDKEAELDRDLEARKRVEDILVRPEKYRLKDANEAEEFPVTVAAEKEEDGIDSSKMAAYFPKGHFDVNAQQVDLRDKNSWLLKLEEVSTTELIEVFAINAVAPFTLNSKLKPLLEKSRADDLDAGLEDIGRYIVNVSAMEGKFYRFKNPNHPHTNMAKASLNMMTRTSAQDYAKSGIYMNSVDTGWINDENPLVHASRIAKSNNFQTPIDEVDAAARVLDPVVTGVKDKTKRVFGLFLKDYRSTEW